jgi:hypothetical protein
VSSQNTFGACLLHSSCTRAIFIAVLAINDKHMLSVKHFPTKTYPIICVKKFILWVVVFWELHSVENRVCG